MIVQIFQKVREKRGRPRRLTTFCQKGEVLAYLDQSPRTKKKKNITDIMLKAPSVSIGRL